MAALDRYVSAVLKEEGGRLLRRQGAAIASATRRRSGALLSGRSVSVSSSALSFRHKSYERFLDMRSGGRKRRRIHNRFVFGAYASVARKLLAGAREEVAEAIRLL